LSPGDYQHFSRKSRWAPGEKQKDDRKKGGNIVKRQGDKKNRNGSG
jgi:hypothetical protein